MALGYQSPYDEQLARNNHENIMKQYEAARYSALQNGAIGQGLFGAGAGLTQGLMQGVAPVKQEERANPVLLLLK